MTAEEATERNSLELLHASEIYAGTKTHEVASNNRDFVEAKIAAL